MCNCNCNCNEGTCSNEEEYEEFVPYKEYPVGGFFKFNNKIFKVVLAVYDGDCPLCDFRECTTYCTKWERKDMNEVEFILYDTLDANE